MVNIEFVPYELSLKLKELGFNENCLEYYDSETKAFCDVIKEVPAPLFSQTFKWFREKYNLHHVILFENTYKKYDYIYGEKMSGEMLGKSDTYEEAELACLEKLIEIVENN